MLWWALPPRPMPHNQIRNSPPIVIQIALFITSTRFLREPWLAAITPTTMRSQGMILRN